MDPAELDPTVQIGFRHLQLLSQISDEPFMLLEFRADRPAPLLRWRKDVLGENVAHHLLIELIHGLDRPKAFPVEYVGDVLKRVPGRMKTLHARF
jgi:hypothetical protein